ncbi:MAG TPA: STAS domain-containing protein [Spirochaetota bacterium]
MTISMRDKGSCTIFDIEGEIPLSEVDRFESFIYKNLSASHQYAYLIIRNIPHISSTLIGSFVRIQKTVKNRGIRIGIVSASAEAQTLFRITGIVDQFHFYQTEDEIPL